MVCGRHKIENIFLWFQLSNIHFDYLNCTINQFAEIERNILYSLCVFGQTYFSTRNRKRHVYRGAFPTFMGATSYLHVIRKIINFTTSSLCVCAVCFGSFSFSFFDSFLRQMSETGKFIWRCLWKLCRQNMEMIMKHALSVESWKLRGVWRSVIIQTILCTVKRARSTLIFSNWECEKITADPGYFLRVNKIANMNCQYKELENYAFFWNAVGMCGPVTHRNSILGVGLLFITATPKNNSFPKTRLETYTTFGYYNVFVWLRFASDGRRM